VDGLFLLIGSGFYQGLLTFFFFGILQMLVDCAILVAQILDTNFH
jgi:hypothetical protein